MKSVADFNFVAGCNLGSCGHWLPEASKLAEEAAQDCFNQSAIDVFFLSVEKSP